MSSLGAVEALNLDGGGSSTFVVKGKVGNRPSDRAVIHAGRREVVHVPGRGDKVLGLTERPVATSLELVPRGPDPLSSDKALQRLDTAAPAAPTVPYASDPGSDPTGRLPAIVLRTHAVRGPLWPATAVMLAVLAATLTAASRTRLRRLRLRVELAR
jgi:hypothetical protein